MNMRKGKGENECKTPQTRENEMCWLKSEASSKLLRRRTAGCFQEFAANRAKQKEDDALIQEAAYLGASRSLLDAGVRAAVAA